MKLIKLYYHINAAIKKLFYGILSGGKIKFGKSTTFRAGFHAMTEQSGRITVGANCFFNNGCSINSLQEVVIGDGTIFGANCHIYDHNHRFRDADDSIKSQGYSVSPVHIGKHVWMGTNVVVLKGVTIGDNVVIGAGCVVEQDIPANSIVTQEKNLVIREQESK